MAFQMTVEAADGRSVEDAYWVPVQINIGSISKSGQMTFYAYSSSTAMDEGKAPIAGALKSYSFTEAEFVAAQMTPMSVLFPEDPGIQPTTIMYDVLARFAYGVARNRKDVDSGEKDGDDNPIMVSFFENATNV